MRHVSGIKGTLLKTGMELRRHTEQHHPESIETWRALCFRTVGLIRLEGSSASSVFFSFFLFFRVEFGGVSFGLHWPAYGTSKSLQWLSMLMLRNIHNWSWLHVLYSVCLNTGASFEWGPTNCWPSDGEIPIRKKQPCGPWELTNEAPDLPDLPEGHASKPNLPESSHLHGCAFFSGDPQNMGFPSCFPPQKTQIKVQMSPVEAYGLENPPERFEERRLCTAGAAAAPADGYNPWCSCACRAS